VAQLAETGTSAGTDPDTSRFRLFDAVTTAITSAADECLIVIVLDDLHWADQGSLLLLEFMAPAISTARLLVIASYRDTDITRSHPLAHALGVLARSPVTRVALAGLDVEEVARYIMTATGVASDPLAAVIRRKTEGNPFFVHELVALLDDEGRLATGDPLQSLTVAIPPAVRDVINRRCARLSDSAAHLVQVAAIAGPIFRHDVLEAVSGFEDEQLLDAVDEALSEGLIVEDDDQPGSYRFSHDLVCDTVRSELSAMRRARLHGRVGEALEALLNSPMPPQAAEIAYHLMLAAPADKYADKAIRYAVRAAEQATSALAYEDAVAHYERALETWANVPRPDAYRRCELLLALGDARWRAGQAARADSAFLEAVDLARTVDDPRLLAKAVLGLGGGLFRDWHVSTGTANQDRIQLLEQALNALGDLDGRLRVRLLGQLAEELYYSSVAHRRLQLSREAVETAELLGDQWTLAYALCSRCLVTWTPDHLDERLELAAQIAALGEALSSPELMLFGRHYLFVAQTELGDIRAAASTLGAFEQMASELRQPLYLWTARSLRALEALFVGRFAAAERLATEALEMGQRAQVADAVNIFAAQLGMIRREQGRLQEIEPAIRTFVEQFPEAPVWRAALALVAALAGRSADAQEALDWLARDDFGRVPRDFAWLAGLALLAEVCSILGDQSRATVLYRLLQPFAHRNVMAGDRTCWGAAAHYLGILAATIGRFDEAEQWLQRALDMNRRMGAAPWVARGLYELGRLQLHRAEQPPGLDAATLFDEARELAEQLGMAQLLGKIEHAAASRRSPHAPSHPTARSRP
jgi:tetratricopeptide (TPR) repeat protein